jgi:hypothetical protein
MLHSMVPKRNVSIGARSVDEIARAILRSEAGLRVHSVFERAVNLVDESGTLLGLIGPAGGEGPATVVLSGVPSWRVVPGDSCPIRAGRLVIGVAELDWVDARVWRPRHASRTVDAAELRRRTVRVARALADIDDRGGFHRFVRATPAPSDSVTSAWIGALASITTAMATDTDPTDAIRGLVGLGPGLTPSGDDFIVGLACTFDRLGDPRAATLRTAIGVVLAERPARTTDIGAARLRHAAAGRLEEASERVLREMLSGDGARLEDAAIVAANWGHSSGIDTIVGMLRAMKLVDGEAQLARWPQHQ